VTAANGLAALVGTGWAEPFTLALMLAGFGALAVWRRWPIGVALLLSAWVGAAVNGDWLPARHLAEGAFSYLDPILVIVTAMIFMRALADGGALVTIVGFVQRRLGHRPAVLLPMLMGIVMFPGMITGSSTASVLATGTMVGSMLVSLGLSRERAGAIIAMGGVLGMVAPPINLPAMLIGAGIDLPYAGFAAPLAVAAFPLAIVVVYWLGWPALRARTRDQGQALAAPMTVWWALVAPLAAAALMAAPRVWPAVVPDYGLPLTFLVSAGLVVVVSPRFRVIASLLRATEEVLPVAGILTGVGAFIQVMTVTGGRGWLVAAMLGAPSWAVFGAAAVSIPLFGAVSAFGSASVLGVPFLLALLGRNEIVTTSALSMLAALGDLMLPAALAATLAAQAVGMADRRRVLRLCVVPALGVVAVAILMLAWSPQLGRWLR
jgi:TRAP-type C4-dicarboxylate transport system permease large subunit